MVGFTYKDLLRCKEKIIRLFIDLGLVAKYEVHQGGQQLVSQQDLQIVRKQEDRDGSESGIVDSVAKNCICFVPIKFR